MLCWVPISAFWLAQKYDWLVYDYVDDVIVLILSSSNTLFDPVIYSLRFPVVRQGYAILFRKICNVRETREVSGISAIS